MRAICSIIAKKSLRRLFGGLFILALTVTLSGPGTATAAPTVTTHSPSAGATGVPVTATVSATFSDPMDLKTITSGSVTLAQWLRISAIAAGYNYSVVLRDNGTVTSWGYNGNGQSAVPSGLNGVTAIAAGSNHILALKSDSTVVAWGDNGSGRTTVPAGLSAVTAIAAGSGHSVALKNDGTVTAWGDNWQGQINVPGGLSGVTGIAAGGYHTLAVKGDGTVVAWGGNSFGQTTVSGLSGVIDVAAGRYHSVALRADGTVVAWGDNRLGQTSVPAGLSGVIAISTNLDYTMALKNDGSVVAWGDNSSGQTDIPADLSGITAIAAGYFHIVALKNDGTVITWGDNSYGQFSLPVALSGVKAAAAGAAHTVVLKNNDTIFAWGYNLSGQTDIPVNLSSVSAIAAAGTHTLALNISGSVIAWGNNDFGQTNVPAVLGGVTAIAAGHYHSVALKNDGTVAAWGRNDSFQSTVPAGLAGVTKIAAGSAHTLALKQDGTVTAWGLNSFGQTTIPLGLSGVTAIAAAGEHSVALKNDGTVSAWGNNTSGQSTVPTGLTNVIAIAAGFYHTVALKSDGTVVAWGRNLKGQTTVPAGLSGVVGIAAGDSYTVAVKNDGTLISWGDNTHNQVSMTQDLYYQPIDATISYSTGNDSVTISPAAALPAAATLIATVNTGVHSLTGIHPAADDSWSFTTSDPVPPVTTASPAGGTYDSLQNVTLTANEPATIYYTTNGATPTLDSAVYSGPLAIAKTTTLQFFAMDNTGNIEAPQSATYTIVADTTPPLTTAYPAGGTYSSAQNVILIASEPATIYYTTNGATPSTTSPIYSGAIPITVSTGLKFFARDAVGNNETIKSANYTINLDTSPPITTASPAGGIYSSAQSVILTANEPATIYYTTNGATPTSSSTVYSGSIPIPASTVLKFFARDTAGNSETVKSATYTINLDTTPPITSATPAGGTYSSAQNVTLTANEPATIYYTTNGATPSTSSPVYSGSIPIPASTVLKFFARDTTGNSESVKSAIYTINIDTTPPITSATPAGGAYSSAQNVTLTANEPATIYYTTNGATPSTSSPVYLGSIPIPVSTVLKFFARDTAGNSETVKTESYTIKQNQTITFGLLPAKTYGDPAFTLNASASSGLPVSYTSNNPAVASVSGNTVTIFAAGVVSITATQGGNATYNPATSVSRIQIVNKAVLTVQAANATRMYGTANPAFSATYSGFVNGDTQMVLSGSPALTTAATVASPVDSYPITAATGTLYAANYSLSFVNGTLTVTKANQTINFGILPVKTYNDPAFNLAATSTSGLPLSYTSSNSSVATVSGTTVTILAAGTATITASQSGNDNYNAAPAVVQSLTVNKATATVTLGSLSTTYDGTPKAATATTIPAGLDVTFTYNGIATAPTAVASYSVVGTVNDPNYQGSASGTMTIAKGDQTITFGALPVKTYGDPAFTLTATASSGLPVTYTSSNSAVATVSGSTVAIVRAGTATITATQAGDGNYNAAPAVAQTLTINKALATISFVQLTFVYDGNPKPVTVTTVPAGLAVTITYDGSSTAPTESGNYVVVATVNDANYQGTATATEEIAKKSQTITFGPLPVKTYGDADFTISASASSNLTLTFTSDPPIATIVKQGGKNSYLVTIVGAGTTIVTATQAGNRNYSDAPPVSQTLVVNKADATVSLGSLSANYDGTAKAATATTSPAGLAVTFTYNGSAVAPTAAGSYSVVGTINNANYQGSASGTVLIAKAGQAITFGALPAMSYGTAPFNPNAAATSNLAISYSSSNPAVATVSGTTVTIVGIGTTTITASQGGDGNYNAAVDVPQTLTISKGTATISLGGLTTTYNGTLRPITATTAPSGLPVTVTYNDSATAPTAAGTYTVVATVTSPNYQGSTTGTLTIAKAAQTITFGALPDKTVGNAPFTLTGMSTSGLAISYSSSNPAVATVSGSTVTIVGAGSTTIAATQGGNENYNAANSVARTLTVQAAQASSGKTKVTIGAISSYFDTVAATLAAIAPGSTAQVKLQTLTFVETVNFNISGATVSLSGGYDVAFANAAGMTTIQGNLVISAGTLVADRLVIM